MVIRNYTGNYINVSKLIFFKIFFGNKITRKLQEIRKNKYNFKFYFNF